MRIAWIVVLSLSLVLAGCTSVRSVPLADRPAEALPAVVVGDRIEATMRSGEQIELHVTSVAPGTLAGTRPGRGGGTVEIAMADVQSLGVRRFSGWRTAGLALGVVTTLAVALLVALVVNCSIDDRECSGD